MNTKSHSLRFVLTSFSAFFWHRVFVACIKTLLNTVCCSRLAKCTTLNHCLAANLHESIIYLEDFSFRRHQTLSHTDWGATISQQCKFMLVLIHVFSEFLTPQETHPQYETGRCRTTPVSFRLLSCNVHFSAILKSLLEWRYWVSRVVMTHFSSLWIQRTTFAFRLKVKAFF